MAGIDQKKGLESGMARVGKKIENSRRDGKSDRVDFLIFVFLISVKLSHTHSEKLAHLSE